MAKGNLCGPLNLNSKHTSCWPLTSHCRRPLHHHPPPGVSGSPSQASLGDHRRSRRCPSARWELDEHTRDCHRHICSLLWVKREIEWGRLQMSTSFRFYGIYCELGCAILVDWQGVEAALLVEAELAEAEEPTDLRGAEAATAGKLEKSNKMHWVNCENTENKHQKNK